MSTEAKQILDRWATLVAVKDSIFLNNGRAQIDRTKDKIFGDIEYSPDIILWIPPATCMRIEFEDEPEKNKAMVLRIEHSLKSLEIDYCITDHGGKSQYINIFNLQGIPVNEDNKRAKMLLFEYLAPKVTHHQLDKTNLGFTFSPVIGHPHWKPKYNGAIHKIIRGKEPLLHKNKYPKELLKKLEQYKKNVSKIRKQIKGNDGWVEDFLINYCCNNELPKGARHSVIEKNLAILISSKNETEQENIKRSWEAAQGGISIRGWELAVLNGQYTEVNAGELANYIKNNELNYTIPRPKVPDFVTGPSEGEARRVNKVLEYLGDKKRHYATEEMVQRILNKARFYTIRHDQQPEMFIYQEGIYVQEGESYIKEECRNMLGPFYTNTLARDVIDKIQADTYIKESDFFKVENIDEIPIKNGIFNLKTRELRPFTPDEIHFTKINAVYDPKAKYDKMKAFIDSILDSEEDKLLIQEWFGFCLHRTYKFHKSLMFIGKGSNGKTILMDVLKKLIGEENTTGMSLREFYKPDNFNISDLFGKMLNVGPDISSASLTNVGLFKSLSCGESVSVPRKYKNSLNLKNYAKFVFSCNELPATLDTSDGFFRRWLYVEFLYRFFNQTDYDKAKKEFEDGIIKEEEFNRYNLANPNILNELTTPEEMDGLFIYALDGFKRLMENGRFTFNNTTKDVQKFWNLKSNSFKAFAEENLKVDQDKLLLASELTKKYTDYCKANNVKPVKYPLINAVMVGEFGAYKDRLRDYDDGSRPNVWRGVDYL